MSPKNSCPCPVPPGGQAVCEAHQLAICRIKNNVVETACVDPPALAPLSEDSSALVMANFILASIFDVTRDASQILAEDDLSVLRASVKAEGESDTVDSHGRRVSFRIPVPLLDAIQPLLVDVASEDDSKWEYGVGY